MSRYHRRDRAPDGTPRLSGGAWQRVRDRFIRIHPLCARCEQDGRVTLAVNVDHIIPVDKNGTDDESNLQSLCHDCHARKSALESGKGTPKPKLAFDPSGNPLDPAHHFNKVKA